MMMNWVKLYTVSNLYKMMMNWVRASEQTVFKHLVCSDLQVHVLKLTQLYSKVIKFMNFFVGRFMTTKTPGNFVEPSEST